MDYAEENLTQYSMYRFFQAASLNELMWSVGYYKAFVYIYKHIYAYKCTLYSNSRIQPPIYNLHMHGVQSSMHDYYNILKH